MLNAKTHFIIYTTIFIILLCNAMVWAVENKSWQTIYIKELGSIAIPSTMEVQQGDYLRYQNEIYQRMEYDTPQLVIQQKGLNELSKQALQKYVRVLINTEYGKVNEFEKLDFDISSYSKIEIDQLSRFYKSLIESSFKGTGLLLIDYFPLKLEKINGMSCLHISYIRQLNDNPPVRVDAYIFHNSDRMHELTLSYRLNEEHIWKADLKKVLSSFNIINVR